MLVLFILLCTILAYAMYNHAESLNANSRVCKVSITLHVLCVAYGQIVLINNLTGHTFLIIF